MSTRINLKIHTTIDLELLEEGIAVKVVRLLSRVKFLGKEGWTTSNEAIIDTGSPVSIVPYSIWQEAEVNLLLSKEITLHGISSKDDPGVAGRIGEVTLVFIDERSVSPPIEIKTYLLSNDEHPLIIGFEDVLTRVQLTSNYQKKIAFLQF